MFYRLAERQVTFASDDYFIAPNASLIGSVQVGHQASIWFNAVLRGDCEPIAIGEASNVQDGAVLHADPGFPLTLGRGVTVGHLAMLHGCTVGDYSLIGIHATVLNGARIGRYCVIGAHALVTEGMEVPDGSVVLGTPGRIVRTLAPEQWPALEQAAADYVQNGARYLRDLEVWHG